MVGGTRRGFLLVNIKLAAVRSGYIEVGVIRAVESGNWTVWENVGSSALPARSSRGIEGSDLRLTGLVDVAKAEEFCAPGAHISDLNESPAKLLLHVEVEILGI